MPRLLRAFAYLFIAFPGAILWLYGVVFAVGGIASAIVGGSTARPLMPLILIAMGAGVTAVGYLMVICTRILCGDPREKPLENHLPQRAAWDLGSQGAAILISAAGFAIIHCISEQNWMRLALGIVFLAMFVALFFRLSRHRMRVRQLWLKEFTDAETARALLTLSPPRFEAAPRASGPANEEK